jgi:transcriptional regulator with XRE-family HTH domain
MQPACEGARELRRQRQSYASVVAGPASSLGDFIRQQRELSAMSMREFARLAGISNPYLSQIERGLRAPSEQVLQAIADTLKVSAETLYEQAGVPPEPEGPSKVAEAIREDPNLTGRQRQALTEVYEAFVATGPRTPRPRRPPAP